MFSVRVTKNILIVIGTISLGVGVLGVFLPLLPTTPFLLISTACYARSSEKFYNWLLSNKWFGEYIKNYREKRGIPLKVKISSISLLWLTIIFSIVFIVKNIIIEIILFLIASVVTLHIISIRTLSNRER